MKAEAFPPRYAHPAAPLSHRALSSGTQENPTVASPSWIRGRDMGFFDADDMSSVAGGSEISSTLSYMDQTPGTRRYGSARAMSPRCSVAPQLITV
jgi:hypothetical protein